MVLGQRPTLAAVASLARFSRSVQLFQDFRVEQTDPERFYSALAADSVAQLQTVCSLRDADVLDVGGGPGYFAAEFAKSGARYWPVEAQFSELFLHGRTPLPGTILGDGEHLPVKTGVIDIAYSSNVLEHVRQPWTMANEMVRVTKPGGIIYLSYTLWYGPWGGHETAPWHFLGGKQAAKRYEHKYGKPPKNLYGQSLFPITARAGINWAQRQRQADVLAIFPRYLPKFAFPVVHVPVLREFLTWNLVLILRKKPWDSHQVVHVS